jgi:dihydroorotase-like cyclic amidohydrolase
MKSKSHNTPVLDQALTGAVTHTFVGGELVYARGE